MASAAGKFGALAEIGELRGKPVSSVRSLVSPGRANGKRSNPEFKQFSVQLKRAAQRKATDILRQRDDGTDFSDLMQDLLEDWLGKQ